MQTAEILAAIDEEITRLQQVRNLLSDHGDGRGRRGSSAARSASAFPFGATKPSAPRKRRKLSAVAPARIAAAQKARWARLKKARTEKGKNGKK